MSDCKCDCMKCHPPGCLIAFVIGAHTATDDVLACPSVEPRRFVLVHGGTCDGLSVCEHCLMEIGL